MNHKPILIILAAALLALGLVLFITGPASAEEGPPPEEPAALPEAPPAAVEGGGGAVTVEGETALAFSAANTPLAVAGGDLGILTPKVYFYVGAMLHDFDQPQMAVDWIVANNTLPSDRKIYFETGTFNGLTIDGTAADSVQEQIKGLDGPGTFPNNTGAATINGNIDVQGVLSGFSIEGLVVNGTVIVYNSIGTVSLKHVDVEGAGHRLAMSSIHGAITADSISVIEGEGAYFENFAGTNTAGVTVTNGEFFDNSVIGFDANGLWISTPGAAVIKGIDSSFNEAMGLYVIAYKGISLSNSNLTRNNFGGARLQTATSAAVTVNNMSISENEGYGLHIITGGAIVLNQLDGGGNGNDFVRVDDDSGGYSGASLTGKDIATGGNDGDGINLWVNGPVTLTNVFSGQNDGAGLVVYAKGAITLNHITLFENHSLLYEVYLDNLAASSAQPVKILNSSGHNDINGNGSPGDGLGIQTKGAITLSGVDSHDNGYGGMMLETKSASGAVTMTNIGAWNNDGYGIEVDAQGAVTIKSIYSSENALFGILVNNTSAPTPKAVSIDGGWAYNNHDGNGITIQSNGAVTLKRMGAGENHGAGLVVDNTGGTGNVNLTGSSTAWQEFNGNGEVGVWIVTNGTITLSYVNANENGQVHLGFGDGVYLANIDSASPKAVTASNMNARGNYDSGLIVGASGAITITNINASDNGGSGAELYSESGAVKVLRTVFWNNEFNDNDDHGLWIEAFGAVTLGRLNANWNGDAGEGYDGVHIDNCQLSGDTCAGKWAVTLGITSGWGYDASGNSGEGVEIISGGAVKVSNLNASNNHGSGLLVDTNWINAAGAVTLGSVSSFMNNFWGNGDDGVWVLATGAISMTNFQAGENGRYGVNLYNAGEGLTGFKPQAVTLTNGQADHNYNGDGIFVRSLGNIKLTDIATSENDLREGNIQEGTSIGERLVVDNVGDDGDVYYFTSPDTDLLTFHLYLEFDAVLDLDRWTGSAWVHVTSVTGTDELVVSVTPTNAGIKYRINIVGTSSNEEGSYLLSLNDPYSNHYSDVGANGIHLVNNFDAATGTVTLVSGPVNNEVSANDNSSTGILIRSNKAVTLTNLFARDNGGRGLDVENCKFNGAGCDLAVPITLNGSYNDFHDNVSDNLYLDSGGKISLMNLSANGSHHGSGLVANGGEVSITSTLSDWFNSFSDNEVFGILIQHCGKVTLNKVGANNNGETGAILGEDSSPLTGAVVVTAATFNNNGQNGDSEVGGINIETEGAVTLKYVDASSNHGGGARIDNQYNTGTPVTIQQSNFSDNREATPNPDLYDGIYIVTYSNITWISSTAGNNWDGDGAQMYTDGTITLLNTYGSNDFFQNQNDGLQIDGAASVTITGIRAGYNTYERGLLIEGVTGAVTVTNGVFTNNNLQGVKIGSDTLPINITLNNVTATLNSMDTGGDYAGVSLFSNGGKITVSNSTFTANGDWGLKLDFLGSAGTYSISNTTYYGNNWDYLNGDDGTNNLNLLIVP